LGFLKLWGCRKKNIRVQEVEAYLRIENPGTGPKTKAMEFYFLHSLFLNLHFTIRLNNRIIRSIYAVTAPTTAVTAPSSEEKENVVVKRKRAKKKKSFKKLFLKHISYVLNLFRKSHSGRHYICCRKNIFKNLVS